MNNWNIIERRFQLTRVMASLDFGSKIYLTPGGTLSTISCFRLYHPLVYKDIELEIFTRGVTQSET